MAKQKPVVFIIGDSTVKNGRGDGSGDLWGWGDPIVQFFDTARISVENHAMGGTSSRTFQTKGLWEKVRTKLKKGDFVLMQFGHNDGGALNDTSRARGTIKGTGEELQEIDNLITKEHEVVHSYGWYLRKIIRETKEKGAIPVVITAIPRNDWENGKIRRSVESYPKWAIDVAVQEKVQYVDLNKLMSDKLDTFGEQQVTGKYFFSRDHTHTSAEGAVLSASLVVEGLKSGSKSKLIPFLRKDPNVSLPIKRKINDNGGSTEAKGDRGYTEKLAVLKEGFKTPDSSYGPSILWGWEGEITRDVIIRDLDRFKSLNIRSVNIEAGYGLPSPYLSDGYFELIKFAVEQAKLRGMVIWMIDECKYPSGFAGGKFSKERPDLRMQGLDIYKRIELNAGQECDEAVSTDVLSAAAVNKENGQCQILAIVQGRLHWKAPKGNWQILLVRHKFRTSVTRAGNNPTHGKDTLNSLCDYLNPVAVRQFVEFTHEQYKKHVGSEFGKTFLGFRGDEPDYGFVPWTPALPDEFLRKKGYDVRPWVAAFLVKNPTDSMLRVKADYWDVWSDMFSENFFKVQADWCAANNLSYMVHLNHEDKMMALAQSGGDFFKDLRSVQVPGVDAIWNQIWPGTIADFPKYASSVAHVYGHQKAMSESFAAYRTPPSVDQAKWVTDHQFARGINLFEWMYWPASTSGDGSPKGWFGDAKFPQVAQYTNRVSYLLSNGKPAANIAVYYPTESEWLGEQKADSSSLDLCRMLLENQRDFDFIDGYALDHIVEMQGAGMLNKSNQLYKTILIPHVKAMSKSVLEKLKSYLISGGKVVFTGAKPSVIVDHSFRNAGSSYNFDGFIFAATDKLLSYLPVPDFNLKNKFPEVKYNHRKFSDGDLYFVFNEGDSAIETDLTLSGKGKVQLWNPATSEIVELKQVSVQDNQVQMPIHLAPWETQIIVVGNQ